MADVMGDPDRKAFGTAGGCMHVICIARTASYSITPAIYCSFVAAVGFVPLCQLVTCWGRHFRGCHSSAVPLKTRTATLPRPVFLRVPFPRLKNGPDFSQALTINQHRADGETLNDTWPESSPLLTPPCPRAIF
ncbi:hypothetical protein ACLOJK_014429 [Asimina triloba]